MTTIETPIEKFWDAVITQDYETVRQALAAGFDVNARIPGKVAPIIFAQPAEDMIMLKMLWAAGASPATPWLEAVFADFANGSDGSRFKRKKSKPVGKFVLHRFNGDEEFALERAVMRIEHHEDKSWLVLAAETNGIVIKSLPNTADLKATPSAQISILLPASETKDLVGRKLSLPVADDEQSGDYGATIYYVEHEALEANELEFVSKKKKRYWVKWTGLTTDVNYYDGSKPQTRIEIEGWFTVSVAIGSC
jgi:hypothetical protein